MDTGNSQQLTSNFRRFPLKMLFSQKLPKNVLKTCRISSPHPTMLQWYSSGKSWNLSYILFPSWNSPMVLLNQILATSLNVKWNAYTRASEQRGWQHEEALHGSVLGVRIEPFSRVVPLVLHRRLHGSCFSFLFASTPPPPSSLRSLESSPGGCLVSGKYPENRGRKGAGLNQPGSLQPRVDFDDCPQVAHLDDKLLGHVVDI